VLTFFTVAKLVSLVKDDIDKANNLIHSKVGAVKNIYFFDNMS
jgi:hypothetical protein